MMKRWFVIVLSFVMMLLCASCEDAPASVEPMTEPTLEPTFAPTVKAAVKAVWIPFMEVNEMLASGDEESVRAAITACMEDCSQKGFNTVYFHVRANSDAYYESAVFPFHKSVKPLIEAKFDPLVFAVEKAHEMGMELHAWVNPYRIGADVTYAVCEDIFEYEGKWYYDPSSEAVRAIVIDGVRELVKHYDIDGVQFDDYFYPNGAVTADTPAVFEENRFSAYQSSGGTDSLSDWRRHQVSMLVSAVRTVCHEREGCVFGISPAYNIDHVRDDLYADVEEWARTEGYVDYLCPQLYFGFTHQSAPFEQIFTQWRTLERNSSVALYIGLGMYKTGLFEDTYAGYGKTEWANGGDIMARQIELIKQYAVDGVAVYSHQSFAPTDDRDAQVIQKETEALVQALSQWK